MFNLHWAEATTEEEVVGVEGMALVRDVEVEASDEVGDGVGRGSTREGDVEMVGKVLGDVGKG